MNAFKVILPGFMTTFQDLGRRGFGKYGVPVSGAMDSIALRTANLLVGNKETDVGLEVTLQNLKMMVLAPVFVAVTGADLQLTINSEYHAPWRNFMLNKGDVIHFKKRVSGVRAYLTVRGGFMAPTFLGSASVFVIGGMGSPLKKDDILRTGDSGRGFFHEMRLPDRYLPIPENKGIVRVIAGPQTMYFKFKGLASFLNSSFRVKPQSNRMAYLLEGEKIAHVSMDNIISEPVTIGSIQVTGKGDLVVLMVDGQVTGGYAKIANVISADISLLSQTLSGESVRFIETDIKSACGALARKEELLSKINKKIAEYM